MTYRERLLINSLSIIIVNHNTNKLLYQRLSGCYGSQYAIALEFAKLITAHRMGALL